MKDGRALRILFLHQGAEMYGSDRVLLNMVSYLAGKGHRLMVILPEEGPLAEGLREAAPVRILPLPVIRRGSFRGWGLPGFFGSLVSSYGAFRKAAGEFEPDIVCTNTATILTGALWARLNRRPHLWLVHEMYRGKGPGRRLYAAVIDLFSRRVVTPSEAVAEDLIAGRKTIDRKIRVIPNGIVPEDYSGKAPGLRKELGLTGGEILAGIAGRFNWWKGQREMIPAMAEAIRENSRLHFVFAGAPFRGEEGLLRDFEVGTAEAGLTGRVHLLGEVSDMGGFYSDLDLLVLPSIRPEPFGLVLLEAMAAELPVAAFDHGGPHEIVIDGFTGLLVPPGDQPALARAILRLAGNPSARRDMGRAGSERLRALYTAGEQGRRLEELLRGFAGRKPWKLAIMGTRGIPASYGGFETFAEELSAILAERGHRVTVYGRSHYVRRREKEYRGVELAVLPSIRHKYLETVSHALFSCLHGLFRGYDAVLMCNAANSLVCLIPRMGGAGVLINVDGLEWQRKKWNVLGRGWYRLGERAATLFPHRIISDARVIQEYYRGRYGVDSIYIPYGAPDRKDPGREALRSLGLKTDGYFLYVSRLEPENNAHLVIQAYSRVKTDKPLVVVGGAPYNQPYVESLEAMADPRVRFTGFIFGRAYRQLQSGCFAYVHATEVGGTHPALIEGMGMASAVIANDTPENREAAGDGALLYRRNDPGSLAEVMEDLLRHPGGRKSLRKRALKQVRSRYDWNRIADAYEKAFHDIIGDG